MLRNQSRRSEVYVVQEKGRPFPITSGQSHFLLLLPPPHLILSGIAGQAEDDEIATLPFSHLEMQFEIPHLP